MDGMPRPRPPHIVREVTRHGKTIFYVRKGQGNRGRLPDEYGTEGFWAAYRAALEGAPTALVSGKAAPRSFAWAVERYRKSAAWGAFSKATRKQRDCIYKSLEKTIGREPLSRITAETIQNSMNARRDRPHAANNFLKAMRGFYAWAAKEGRLVANNPTLESTMLKGPNDEIGFHTWTPDELEQFEATYPVGTRARLAYDLLLYTGLRRGDVVKLGRQHVRDGIITIRTEKTGEVVFIPILPPLARSIDATPTGDLTFLVTYQGTPFVKEGFGNWFGDVCRAAGCPGSAHGLRKAGATRAAENGASERHLMAIYGWSDGDMARHYTEAANRKRLSIEGAGFLLPNPAPATRKSRTSRKALK